MTVKGDNISLFILPRAVLERGSQVDEVEYDEAKNGYGDKSSKVRPESVLPRIMHRNWMTECVKSKHKLAELIAHFSN